MQFNCKIYIRPREDILDPQGDTIAKALANLSFSGVDEVIVGRYMILRIEAASTKEARSTVDEMCKKLLANPVTEEYEIEITKT
ncbi:phosphoribosylformylglycinamidine synthase subunit PurS [bacterium]|nr:phosphoribosylformylglycinamidine synthase subunit PurS [bacterium]